MQILLIDPISDRSDLESKNRSRNHELGIKKYVRSRCGDLFWWNSGQKSRTFDFFRNFDFFAQKNGFFGFVKVMIFCVPIDRRKIAPPPYVILRVRLHPPYVILRDWSRHASLHTGGCNLTRTNFFFGKNWKFAQIEVNFHPKVKIFEKKIFSALLLLGLI